jgi:hypothetical protein
MMQPRPGYTVLAEHRDASCEYFEGANTYKLHVPPDIPGLKSSGLWSGCAITTPELQSSAEDAVSPRELTARKTLGVTMRAVSLMFR